MLRSAKGASRGDSKPAPPNLRSHNNADWDRTSEGDSTLSGLGGSGPTHTRHCAYRLQLVCTTAALARTGTHIVSIGGGQVGISAGLGVEVRNVVSRDPTSVPMAGAGGVVRIAAETPFHSREARPVALAASKG